MLIYSRRCKVVVRKLFHHGINTGWPGSVSVGATSSHWQSPGGGSSASCNQQQHGLDSSHYAPSVPMSGFVSPSEAELALSSKLSGDTFDNSYYFTFLLRCNYILYLYILLFIYKNHKVKL